jgi:hypothetical protein
MDVVVVFESMAGNTGEIARAVAEGIAREQPSATVTVGRADDVAPDRAAQADLLVVGGPTHAFSMPTPQSRAGAGKEFRIDPPATGVREWLTALPPLDGTRVAAFDTRVRFPLPGHAAPAISRQLRHHGGRPAAEPHGFLVLGKEGPLADGELERAREWGAELARSLVTGVVS